MQQRIAAGSGLVVLLFSLLYATIPARMSVVVLKESPPSGLWGQSLLYKGAEVTITDGGWGTRPHRTMVEVRWWRADRGHLVYVPDALHPELDDWLSERSSRLDWRTKYDYVDEYTGCVRFSVRTGEHDQYGWVGVDLEDGAILSQPLHLSRNMLSRDSAVIVDPVTGNSVLSPEQRSVLNDFEMIMLSASPENHAWAAIAEAHDSCVAAYWNSATSGVSFVALPTECRARTVDWSPDGSLLCVCYHLDGDLSYAVYSRLGDTLDPTPTSTGSVPGPWTLARRTYGDRPMPPMWLANGQVLGLRLSRMGLWDYRKGERYFPWGTADTVAVFRLATAASR